MDDILSKRITTKYQIKLSQCFAAAREDMKVNICVSKYGAIFLLLTVFVLIFILRNMDDLKNKVSSTIFTQRVSTNTSMHQAVCTYQPLSTEDAVEASLLLDSIAWPETPPSPAPVSLEQTSDPAHSTFTVLPRKGGGQWHVGDQLEVMIKIYDFKGSPRKSGGDFLIARLHNRKLSAGVAGQVVDHLNGSYSAVFSLLWEGDAQVEVTLVHPSEAITVLRRLNQEKPDRIYFQSVFRSGSQSETTTCNVCLPPTQQPLCNYTDLHTGEPWFCYKPKKLSCNARITHAMGGHKLNFTTEENRLFQNNINLKVSIQASGPASVTVLPEKTGQSEVKNSIVKSGPSGYYYQGVWQSLGGTTVRQFNTSSDITQCLKGKVVHVYGDSTIRQWFEYLHTALPDLKEFNLHSQKQGGPFLALDYTNNIMLTFRCHSTPLRITDFPTRELRYIANELDNLVGGANTVVAFTIWAHFGNYPMEFYIRRLQNIRRAVVRLLDVAPDTRVIIRTGNPKELNFMGALTNSDWYSLQNDKVLRAMFKGLNVHLVDAWEMVLAHHLPHNLHPQPPIIKNMIDVLLTYICPQKGS
ncbi:NXPE family member 3 isoform X3 [Lates calcarifer]|uniref:NXPE family member 3 isoform X3 n=1 Tax=Lates calcarifer TaxID=8187 RepID=A0AAJ8BJK1_LATCA|nr:NXPE family member 3 isoform X3 [Lates calcarifer]